MAGIVIKAVVQLARTSGISGDTVDNDFYFASGDASVTPTVADNLKTSLANFYNVTAAGASNHIAEFIGTQISRAANAAQIKFYASDQPIVAPIVWGSPQQVRSFTLAAAAAGNNLPGEVAYVNTVHADLTDIPETAPNPGPGPATIRPAARRRGRIFIGPLTVTAMTQGSPNFEPTPTTAFQNAIGAASVALLANPSPGVDWVVCSQADQELYSIVGGWVDNAFDSQRRRGNESTSRATW